MKIMKRIKLKKLFSYFFMIIFLCFFSVHAKKIIVTGGAGFIGSHLVQNLLRRGDSVVVIDNLNDGYEQSLKLYNLSQIKRDDDGTNRLVIYQVDICDVDSVEKVFENEKPDLICHLAARAGVRASIENPQEYFRTNIMGTLTIFEMARKFGIKHIVCASSSSVYGARQSGPFVESDTIEKQISPYGMTKHSGELLSYVYHYLFGISVTNLRFFTVYGPRGRIDMAPFIFIDAIHSEKPITVFGNGSAIRDFTYVEDIVDGIIMSIDTPLGYEILNLGRGEPILLSDFITEMEDIIGKKANIEYAEEFSGDVPLTHADITKAKKLIDYTPRTSIRHGLKCMYDWYKNEYLSVVCCKKTKNRVFVFD